MAWIESHESLQRHPKTRRLAKYLGTTTPATIGHLHCMWWWCMSYAPDGKLQAFENWEIAEAAMWDGDEQAFIDALLRAGFIDGGPDGGYHVHDWHDYAGKLIERRETAKAANAERQKRYRDKHEGDSNANITRHVTPSNGPTVPNRTVPTIPNQTVAGVAHDPPTPPATADGNDEKFGQVCSAYSNNIGLLTPVIRESLIEAVDEYGPDWVSQAIGKAARAEKRSMAYISGILRGFKRDGFNTNAPPTAASKADAAPQVLAASIAHYDAFAASMSDAVPAQIYRAYATQHPNQAVIHDPLTPYPLIKRHLPKDVKHA